MQAQQVTIDVLYAARTNLPVMAGPPGPHKTLDSEALFGGLVSVGKVEKGGVSVNLAELYRRMRRLLK